MSFNDNERVDSTTAPGPARSEDLPEQKHVGQVGYGPNFHTGPTLGDKVSGLKEEILGKVKRNPDRVQYGHEIRSGEEKRKKLTGDDEPNPFKTQEDDQPGSSPNLSSQTSNTSRPSGPSSTSMSSPHPSHPNQSNAGSGGFISDSHARELYAHHDAQHEERLAQHIANTGTSGANPQGMAVGQGYGKGAKEQAATVAPQGTKEAEYQRKELWEQSIDAIPLNSTEGIKSLCAYLLVSKSFFLRSRSRLFARTTLDPADVEKTKGLKGLLEFDVVGYPSLKFSIKALNIIWPSTAFTAQNAEHLGGMANGVSVRVILLLLAKARVLQSLELCFMRNTKFFLFYSAYSIYRQVQDIIDSPSLATLKLHNLSRVPASFLRIWKLKELSLTQVTFFPDVQEFCHPINLAPHTQSKAELRTFTYLLQHPLPGQWYNHPSPFSDLRTLSVRSEYKDSGSLFGNMLALFAHTLHTLEIHFGLSSSPYTLQSLTRLRELRFSVSATSPLKRSYFSRCFDCTRDVVESLKTLGSVPPTLNRIVVSFVSKVPDMRFRNEEDWKGLDDVLMETKFEKVKKVEIELIALLAVVDDHQNKEADLMRDFPTVWKKSYPSIPISSTIHSTSIQSKRRK